MMTSRPLLSGIFCVVAFAAASPVHSQTPASANQTPTAPVNERSSQASTQQVGEITVTARSRNETLVDVPIAISVVTSAKLEQLDIRSTTDLANYVPGLEFNNFSLDGRNDRGRSRTLSFRGLALGGAASMFLDGAAVVGNEVPASLDIGQVEVLRGPQSVYFGRSTMTGAVAYRTKAVPDHLVGEGEVEVGQRNLRNVQAMVAGPIVPNLLGGRITALSEDSDGHVTNDYNNGAGKLGDTSRRSISLTLDLTPIPTLDVKAYGNWFHDEDGTSATANVPNVFANCRLPGATQTTFCGEIPGRQNSINYRNTTIPPIFASVLFATPLLDHSGFKKQTGLQRKVSNSHVVADWAVSDYLRLQSITGYHINLTTAASDGIGEPGRPPGALGPGTFPYSAYFFTLNTKVTDFSQEFRLSSDSAERFSWTIGTNYIWNKNLTHAITDFMDQPSGLFRHVPQSLGTAIAQTVGIFGGAYFKVTPDLTVSGEAREQRDVRHSLANDGVTGALLSDLHGTFKSFSPRVSVDYDIGGHRKIYASYATGNRPGGFNTNIAAQQNNPVAFAQIQNLLGVGGITFKEEKLKIGELGFKGEFDAGKGFFDINAYLGLLTNQQITVLALIPALGFSVSGTANAGESKIHGIEFQGNYNFTREFSVSTTFAWNYAKRTKFINVSGGPQFGTTDFSGKYFANVPTYSGSVVGSYNHPLNDNWNFFTNVAAIYRGKQYVDAFNAAFIKGRYQADLRAGVSNDRYTLEGFVKNVFNDQDYTGGNIASATGTLTSNAFVGGWAPPRQFGARFRAKF